MTESLLASEEVLFRGDGYLVGDRCSCVYQVISIKHFVSGDKQDRACCPTHHKN
jgi:hypothetical protein